MAIIGMQLKSPKINPAIALIGKITPDAMLKVIRTLDALRAGVWHIDYANLNARHPHFSVVYYPTNRKGRWQAIFGLNGDCWQD